MSFYDDFDQVEEFLYSLAGKEDCKELILQRYPSAKVVFDSGVKDLPVLFEGQSFSCQCGCGEVTPTLIPAYHEAQSEKGQITYLYIRRYWYSPCAAKKCRDIGVDIWDDTTSEFIGSI